MQYGKIHKYEKLIINQKENYMLFEEALKELRKLSCGVARESWEDRCLFINPYTNEIEDNNGNCLYIWHPTHEDIVATDWETV